MRRGMKLAIIATFFIVIRPSFGGTVEWGSWSPCSESGCGSGLQTRMAICTTGGNSCQNDKGEVREGDIQSQNCNGKNCSTSLVSTQPGTTQTTRSSTKTTNIDTSPITTGAEATRTTSINSTTTMANTPIKATTKQIAPTSTLKNYIDSQKTSSQNPQTPLVPVTPQVSQEEGTKFEGTMKMQISFNKDLTDQSSNAFKDLKKKCETAIKETLDAHKIDGDNECYKFTEGSVVIHYRVTTKNSVKISKLNEAFSWSIKSGPLYSLSVSSFSIIKSSSINKGGDPVDKTQDSDGETFQPYMYFLYGFGGMIGLALVFVLIGVTKYKIKPSRQSKNEEGDEEGYESYFNTPVTDRKLPDDQYSKKPIVSIFDHSKGTGEATKVTKAW